MRYLILILFVSIMQLNAFEEVWKTTTDADQLILNDTETILYTLTSGEESVIRMIDPMDGSLIDSVLFDDHVMSIQEMPSGNLLIQSLSEIKLLDPNSMMTYNVYSQEDNADLISINDLDIYNDEIVLSITLNNGDDTMIYSIIKLNEANILNSDTQILASIESEDAFNYIALFKDQGVYSDLSYLDCSFSSNAYCVYNLTDGEYILNHKQAKYDLVLNDSLLMPVTDIYDPENRQRFLPNYYCIRIQYFDEFRGFYCSAKSSDIARDHFFKISNDLRYMTFVDRDQENIGFLELEQTYKEEEDVVAPFMEFEKSFEEVYFDTPEGLVNMVINNNGNIVFIKDTEGVRELIYMKKDELENIIHENNDLLFEQFDKEILITSKINSELNITVFDILGNELINKNNAGSVNINLHELKSGAYFIRVIQNEKINTFKIML